MLTTDEIKAAIAVYTWVFLIYLISPVFGLIFGIPLTITLLIIFYEERNKKQEGEKHG